MLGGIIAGAVAFYCYRSAYDPEAKPNRNSRKVGQIIVGLAIGFSVQNSDFSSLSAQLPLFGLLTLFLLVSGSAIGYLYSKLARTDLLTAVLATVPGNIGIMASLAADYGRDTALVTLVQLVRFTSVILIIPIVANVSISHDISSTVTALAEDFTLLHPSYFGLLSCLFVITLLAVQIGSRLKIPVAAFLCSILVGSIFNFVLELLPFVSPIDFRLPASFNLIGQVLLGITIGEFWGISPKPRTTTIAYSSIPVALTFLAGFASAGIAMVLMPWDWLTCLLVAVPGGSPEMILIALTLHHDVEVVTAGHLVRLIMINLSLPLMISAASYWDSRPISLEVIATKNLIPEAKESSLYSTSLSGQKLR